jgi:hydrogenase expression/formation protein HypC
MCLAIPMELMERGEFDGDVELNGVRRKISLMLLPEAEVGEFLLVHAGYAIGKLDAEEARETLALLEELARAAGDAP